MNLANFEPYLRMETTTREFTEDPMPSYISLQGEIGYLVLHRGSSGKLIGIWTGRSVCQRVGWTTSHSALCHHGYEQSCARLCVAVWYSLWDVLERSETISMIFGGISEVGGISERNSETFVQVSVNSIVIWQAWLILKRTTSTWSFLR